MPIRNQRLHVAKEEGEQEGADVGTVYVGVAHDHDTPVAQLGQVEVFADTYTDGGDNVFDLLVFEHFVEAGTPDVEDFTAQGENGLEVAGRGPFFPGPPPNHLPQIP